MGASASTSTIQESKQDKIKRIRFTENDTRLEFIKQHLQIVVDEFISNYCEFDLQYFVKQDQVQTALCIFMEKKDSMAVCWRWLYGTDTTIFDHFAANKYKCKKSGPMLVGIRMKAWPTLENTEHISNLEKYYRIVAHEYYLQ